MRVTKYTLEGKKGYRHLLIYYCSVLYKFPKLFLLRGISKKDLCLKDDSPQNNARRTVRVACYAELISAFNFVEFKSN